MEYTDFGTLINLALITVIYSTFIAPNLKRLSELREEIADTEFPATTELKNIPGIMKAGVRLNKKITQYGDKYKETKNFLNFFYVILILLFALQIGLTILLGSPTLDSLLRLTVAVIIVVFLVLAIRLSMITPGRIESIPWLVEHGIGQAFYRQLFGPKLTINRRLANLSHKPSCLKVAIESNMKLTGYSYILIIEDVLGEKLYYSSAGRITDDNHFGRAGHPRTGTTHYHIQISEEIILKPSRYRVKLEFMEAPFSGSYDTSETIIEINGTNGEFQSAYAAIKLDDTSTPYNFKVDKAFRAESISYKEEEASRAATLLISSSKFVKQLRSKHNFSIYDINGLIDKSDIKKAFSRYNLFTTWLKLRIDRKNKRSKRQRLLTKK